MSPPLDEPGLLVTPTASLGTGSAGTGSAVPDLALASLLLRDRTPGPAEVVRVHVPSLRVVAFASRDARSPHIARATAVAREHGFEAVVRSPGGRMVAYDEGAVVIDHVTRAGPGRLSGPSVFADNAEAHAAALRRLTGADVRVGEVSGEYCPGEFSLNVGGAAKVVGSAQRITGSAWLFSTVVQVAMSQAVREAIVAVSAALDYPLTASTVAGLTDFDTAVTTSTVVRALRADYRTRLGLVERPLPARLTAHALASAAEPTTEMPLRVDDWVRTHPPG